LRLISLEVMNFKKLKVAYLPFGKGITKILGRNRAGKSSAIDALAALIGGEKLCPGVPIRDGQDFAEVTGNFEDFTATRKWGKGAGLQIKGRDGVPVKGPQGFLDKVSKRAFDPFAFFRAEPSEQYEILRRLVGIDWTAKDAARESLYGQRTLINRDAEQIKGALARMPVINAPDDFVDVAALIREQDAILAERRRLEEERAATVAEAEQAERAAEGVVNEERRKLEAAHAGRVTLAVQTEREAETAFSNAKIAVLTIGERVQAQTQRVKSCEDTIADLERRIAAARASLATEKDALGELGNKIEPLAAEERHRGDILDAAHEATIRAKAEPIGHPAKELLEAHYSARSRAGEARGAPIALPSLDEVRAKLAGAETINTAVRAKKLRDAEEAKHRAKESEAGALTRQIYAIDKSKMDDLAAAHFPIPNLSISETEVGSVKKRTPTLNGLPLEQASSAEQWGVAIAMGIAEHPELRLMWIKDGSLLDNDALAQIEAAAEAADAQVIIEAVSADGVDRGEGIFIVEGEVVAIDGVPVAKTENGARP
jgi:AAA domain-containing protein